MATAKELARKSWTRKLVPDDDGWFASIEELPGCIASNNSVEETLHDLERNLVIWLEVALEQGSAIPDPLGDKAHFSGRFSVRVPRSLHRQLFERAATEGCSLNMLAVSLLSQGLRV